MDVYALGSNGSGQLGIGHKQDVSVPKPVLLHPPSAFPIIQIAAGGNHTLLLTSSARLYWSGDPATGACGLGSAPAAPVFQEVRLGSDRDEMVSIALIAATWQASFVVARDGDGRRTALYSFGTGAKGELGTGELIVRTPSATRFRDFPPAGTEIVDLSAGMEHVVVVLDNGDAYGWGNCRKAQVGPPGAVVHAPRKVPGLDFSVVRAVCAKESTCFFGAPESGRLRVLGSDKWGLASTAPQTVEPWRDVGASWGNMYVLTRGARLLGWGRDDHGQLPPPNLPRIDRIAVGSEHVVALSEDGDALAWGWGEHGNCGPEVEDNNVKGRWNAIASARYLPPASKISSVGAGCATSWICITT